MKRYLGPSGLALRLSAAAVALSLPALAQFTFNPPVVLPIGTDPHDVAVGDVDGDGDADLVVTLHSPPRLAVIRTLGVGVFGTPEYTDLPANAVPQGLLAPDFDADQLADVVVVSDATSELLFLHNLGNANFALLTPVAIGTGPTELAVADVDADGDLDVAVSNTLGNSIAIVHNLGASQFQLIQQVPVGTGPKALDFGQFFGVGMPSLAVAVHDSHAVYVLSNRGNGYFDVQSILTVPNSTHPECVVAADFDEDGADDLAATFSEGLLNKFALFYQLPSGTRVDPVNFFTAPYTFNVGAVHPTHLVAADFDKDTRVDVAIVSSGTAMVSMLRNLDNRSFGFQTMVTLPGPMSDHMQVADFDADFMPDLVCTNDGGSSLSVLFNALPSASNYCLSVPNSTGVGAKIGITGSVSLAANNLFLRVTDAPPLTMGLFFYGVKPTSLPFQGSFLCVEPPIRRFVPAVQVNANGVATYMLPLAQGLVAHQQIYVLPGDVLNFQFLYRDSRSPNWPRTNFSDGLRIVFEP